MPANQAGPSPPPVSETDMNFIATLYFSPLEIAEARRLYADSGSYAKAIAYLVGCGDDMRRTPAYCTIPGGKVHIPRPGCPEDSMAYVSLSLGNLAQRAFPDPHSRVESETTGMDAQRRQLSFWDEAELVAGGQKTLEIPPKRAKPAHQKRLTYIEQPIARKYGSPIPGWVVKDRGLGYLVEPMRSGDGSCVSLIHLKSKRELVSVIVATLDHERIRAWVSACAQLTDWNQGIMAILKEKPGEQKQRTWSRQLEAIWRDQQTKVKRQLAFF